MKAAGTLGLLTIAAALALAGPAAAVAPSPENQAAPQLQGPSPPQDGLTYTAKAGKWDGPPGMTIARRWLRCNAAGTGCQGISGATASTYKLGAPDVGRRVRVRETATCQVTTPVCQPVTSDSSASGRVLRDPNNEAAPQVSGSAQAGQVLSASVGFWRSPAPLHFGYQWIRCNAAGTGCSNIAGATGAEFRVTAAEVGARLRVVVTARNSRPRSTVAVSAPTLAVAAAPVVKKAPRKRRVRLLSPFPRIVIAGLVTDGAVELTEFTIRGPRRATVRLRCKGRGCPLRSRRLRMRSRRLRIRSLERRWRPGTVLEVTVSRRGFIGKFSRFRFRAGNVPRRQDLCVIPGVRKPKRCPRA